ncbi:FAD-dependent oxidoreductase [Streptomyces mirabilis]|uniref:FAD-dependent oxidoreductase n=1 Tax=Streptomyces mirabilis TaxID=68239 RepID=UPI0036C14BF2
MKVVVDLTRCQGYAQCAFAAPDVFVIQGDEALLYDTDPDDAQREKIVRAAAACPVQAIFLDRDDTRDDTRIRKPAPETHVAAPGPGEAFKRTGRIVIVGAYLAGLRAGRMLRQEGFTGSLTVIGDEPHAPYDRPPLSKQVLMGQVPARRTGLPRLDELDAHWRFGVAATGLDLSGKQVLLADGAKVGFDRLLIATGVRAHPWPNEAEAALDGLFALHTPEDAEGLRQRLAAGPGRVLVIGAGFTGCEVVSACRELDLQVTVLDRSPAPLAGALGAVIGGVAAQMQRDNGVDLRCGVRVESLEGDDSGRLRRARLSDGSTLDVEVAVAALGSIRNVECIRRLLTRNFGPPHRPKRIDGMMSDLLGIVTRLIDDFTGEDGSGTVRVDLVDDFAYPFPVTVICELLGVPREDEPRFQVMSGAVIDTADPTTGGIVERQRRRAKAVAVLADACLDTDPEVHRILTEKPFPQWADVVTFEDWLSPRTALARG